MATFSASQRSWISRIVIFGVREPLPAATNSANRSTFCVGVACLANSRRGSDVASAIVFRCEAHTISRNSPVHISPPRPCVATRGSWNAPVFCTRRYENIDNQIEVRKVDATERTTSNCLVRSVVVTAADSRNRLGIGGRR